MNLKEIRELINLMNEHHLGEIEIEREGMKVKIKKSVSESFEGQQRKIPQYQMETQASHKETVEQVSSSTSKTLAIRETGFS